jgi:acetyltransferase
MLAGGPERREEARSIVETARASGRVLLTEAESKRLLAAYGIPVVETRVAATAQEAVQHAGAIGYPVVLKLNSTTITHKTDVGGVRLDLRSAEAVREAFHAIRKKLDALGKSEAFNGVTVQPMVKAGGYELILGSSLDPQLGPVMLFGAGGMLVEVLEDRALMLPPLTTTLARRAMERTRIFSAFKGVRGQAPVDVKALELLMVRFSQLVVEQRFIKEIDINPLLASPERVLALDARVVLHAPDVKEEQLPPLPITPYPEQYIRPWQLESGEKVLLRPIRPEDEGKLVAFHRMLSEESVYLRYASMMQLSQRIAHDRLARICFIDYAREMTLVAEVDSPEPEKQEIVAVGRLARLQGTQDAEFTLVVADKYHCRGLGTELLRRIIDVGRDWKVERIVADILKQNRPMQHICQNLGFRLIPGDEVVRAVRLIS